MRAVDRGRLARDCARRGCGVPPLGAAAPPGGCGAAVSPAGLRPPTGWWGGGERGGGRVGGRGDSPQSPPGPLAPPPDGRGGAARWFQSRGASRRLGGRTLPPPPSTLWVPDPRAGPRSGPLPSSLSPRGAGWPGGGGGAVSAGGGSSGQRSAVSGLRGNGPALALVAPVLPPTGGAACPSGALYGGGGVGRGARLRRRGRPAALPPSNPLAPIAWVDGARPSLASSLVWGLGLRRWRVPPAVAPAGEGVAQSAGLCPECSFAAHQTA